MFSYASCGDSTLEWASSDTTSACCQSWKACLMHQAPSTRLTLKSCVIFNVACETGIRYPTLPAMLNRDTMLIRISVRCISCYHRLYHVILGYPILQMGYPDGWTLVQSTGPNLSCSVKLDLDLLKPWRVSAAAAAPNDQAVRAVPYSCPVRRPLRTYA